MIQGNRVVPRVFVDPVPCKDGIFVFIKVRIMQYDFPLTLILSLRERRRIMEGWDFCFYRGEKQERSKTAIIKIQITNNYKIIEN
jgi:hypothetical protein